MAILNPTVIKGSLAATNELIAKKVKASESMVSPLFVGNLQGIADKANQIKINSTSNSKAYLIGSTVVSGNYSSPIISSAYMENGKMYATEFVGSLDTSKLKGGAIAKGLIDTTVEDSLGTNSSVKTINIGNTSATNISLNASNLNVSGDTTINGSLTVKGNINSIDVSNLSTADLLIELGSGSRVSAGTKIPGYAGLYVQKYDGVNSGALVFDSEGIAYVGDVTVNGNTLTPVSSSSNSSKQTLQPIATRDKSLAHGNLVKWDNNSKTLVKATSDSDYLSPSDPARKMVVKDVDVQKEYNVGLILPSTDSRKTSELFYDSDTGSMGLTYNPSTNQLSTDNIYVKTNIQSNHVQTNSLTASTITVSTITADTINGVITHAVYSDRIGNPGVNVGSNTSPVYFSGGVPKQCNSTLNVSILGTAEKAKKLTDNITYSGTAGKATVSMTLNAGSSNTMSITNVDASKLGGIASSSFSLSANTVDGITVVAGKTMEQAKSADEFTDEIYYTKESTKNSALTERKVSIPINNVKNAYNAKNATHATNADKASALTTNAGSSTVPVYFTGGVPKQCSTTLGVSITGKSAKADTVLTKNTTVSSQTEFDILLSQSSTNGSYESPVKLPSNLFTTTYNPSGSAVTVSLSGKLKLNKYTLDAQDNAIRVYKDNVHKYNILWADEDSIKAIPNSGERILKIKKIDANTQYIMPATEHTDYLTSGSVISASSIKGKTIENSKGTVTNTINNELKASNRAYLPFYSIKANLDASHSVTSFELEPYLRKDSFKYDSSTGNVIPDTGAFAPYYDISTNKIDSDIRGNLEGTADKAKGFTSAVTISLSGSCNTTSGTFTNAGNSVSLSLSGVNANTFRGEDPTKFVRYADTEWTTNESRTNSMWELWNADDGNDTLVNKVKEVLAAFSKFPEADTLVGEFAKKSDKTETVKFDSFTGDNTDTISFTNVNGTSGSFTVDNVGYASKAGKLAIEKGTSDEDRPVWFNYGSWSSNLGRAVYNDNFMYNPTKQILTAKYFSGVAVTGARKLVTSADAAYAAGSSGQPTYFSGGVPVAGQRVDGTLTLNSSGTGLSVSSTHTFKADASKTVTYSLNSSSAGNADTNKVVLRSAAGEISSEKIKITSSGTGKASMQYNANDDCVEFVFL